MLTSLSVLTFLSPEKATLDTEANCGACPNGLNKWKDTPHAMFMGKISVEVV